MSKKMTCLFAVALLLAAVAFSTAPGMTRVEVAPAVVAEGPLPPPPPIPPGPAQSLAA